MVNSFSKLIVCISFIYNNSFRPRIYVASDEFDVINQLQYLKPIGNLYNYVQYLQSYGHHQNILIVYQ